MAYSSVVKPANKIVAGESPLEQELNIENATNMYPGRLSVAHVDSLVTY